MIKLEKLLARCDFHIGRGENMTIDPAELKEALKPAPDFFIDESFDPSEDAQMKN